MSLSDDARLVLRLLPHGGMVRPLETTDDGALLSSAGFNVSKTQGAGGGWSVVITGGVDPEAVEPLTVREDQLTSFFRASGCGRVEAKGKVQAALAELMLGGLVRSFAGERELPRYSLTEEGAKARESLGD